jgi:hypothetical protein
VLPFGHLDRDRLESLEPRRATQGAATRPVSAEDPRLVAGSNLSHLDPTTELRSQVANEISEIDSLLRREIEEETRSVELLLDPNQLHRQTAFLDLHHSDAMRVSLALLLFETSRHILRGRGSQHPVRGAGRADARR